MTDLTWLPPWHWKRDHTHFPLLQSYCVADSDWRLVRNDPLFVLTGNWNCTRAPSSPSEATIGRGLFEKQRCYWNLSTRISLLESLFWIPANRLTFPKTSTPQPVLATVLLHYKNPTISTFSHRFVKSPKSCIPPPPLFFCMSYMYTRLRSLKSYFMRKIVAVDDDQRGNYTSATKQTKPLLSTWESFIEREPASPSARLIRLIIDSEVCRTSLDQRVPPGTDASTTVSLSNHCSTVATLLRGLSPAFIFSSIPVGSCSALGLAVHEETAVRLRTGRSKLQVSAIKIIL